MLLSFFAGYESQMYSLIAYTIAIIVYLSVVWTFYNRLSHRNMFKLPQSHAKVGSIIKGFFKYLLLFPAISFAWFGLLSLFLFFLSKSQGVEQILLLSMTIVAATRVSAYINEEMAGELSKIVPIVLLGLFIIDPVYFSLETSLAKISQSLGLGHLILRYFIFVVALEFSLRILRIVGLTIRERKLPEKIDSDNHE
jgi:hypothetical protein